MVDREEASPEVGREIVEGRRLAQVTGDRSLTNGEHRLGVDGGEVVVGAPELLEGQVVPVRGGAPHHVDPLAHEALSEARVHQADRPGQPTDRDRQRIADMTVVAVPVAGVEGHDDVGLERAQTPGQIVGEIGQRGGDESTVRGRAGEPGIDVIQDHHVVHAEHDRCLAEFGFTEEAEWPGVGRGVGSSLTRLAACRADHRDVGADRRRHREQRSAAERLVVGVSDDGGETWRPEGRAGEKMRGGRFGDRAGLIIGAYQGQGTGRDNGSAWVLPLD